MFWSSILAMEFTITLMYAALALLVVILVVSMILDRGASSRDRREVDDIRGGRRSRSEDDTHVGRAA